VIRLLSLFRFLENTAVTFTQKYAIMKAFFTGIYPGVTYPMVYIKRVVLDVLKPHNPNALDFTTAIAEKVPGCRIKLTVTAMDEKTETVLIVIEGEQVQFNVISEVIGSLGGSIHSIDEVEVENGPPEGETT
jgi:hypothetical protein